MTPQSAAADWMAELSDGATLADLTIPGTHQSCARYAGPSFGFLQCQNVGFDLDQQLDAGVRYLDIRCRAHRRQLRVHHASVFQHKTFEDVLSTCGAFLAAHPGETILMRIRQEASSVTPEAFRALLIDHTSTLPHGDLLRWHGALSSLGAVRGKITLISGPPCVGGIAWKGALMDVQDDYEVRTLETKTRAVVEHLRRAAYLPSGMTRPLLVNHACGYRFPLLSRRRIARYVVPRISQVMRELGESGAPGGLGVVALDYADEAVELVEQLIAWNAPLRTVGLVEKCPESLGASVSAPESDRDRSALRSPR
ncbi:phosphatidylinositol-specific phospholipase C [Nocardia sp. CA-128927]|uniref:phosphatidylinositol-specific phospholipase C n=1 Tax=Nocardia sp. CA-128927 TaxID=3239975 RepID=UPI003D956168